MRSFWVGAAGFCLALTCAGCTVTTTFDFARPAAGGGAQVAAAETEPAAAHVPAGAAQPAAGGNGVAQVAGLYDKAADALVKGEGWHAITREQYWAGAMQAAASFSPGAELGKLRGRAILSAPAWGGGKTAAAANQ